MSYSTLRYEISDAGVATISLDQPDTRNALSDELLDELIAALEAARDDDAVRCVVLRSTHERVVSAVAAPTPPAMRSRSSAPTAPRPKKRRLRCSSGSTRSPMRC